MQRIKVMYKIMYSNNYYLYLHYKLKKKKEISYVYYFCTPQLLNRFGCGMEIDYALNYFFYPGKIHGLILSLFVKNQNFGRPLVLSKVLPIWLKINGPSANNINAAKVLYCHNVIFIENESFLELTFLKRVSNSKKSDQ